MELICLLFLHNLEIFLGFLGRASTNQDASHKQKSEILGCCIANVFPSNLYLPTHTKSYKPQNLPAMHFQNKAHKGQLFPTKSLQLFGFRICKLLQNPNQE